MHITNMTKEEKFFSSPYDIIFIWAYYKAKMFIFGIFSFLCARLANTIVTHFICRILIVKVKHGCDVAHTARPNYGPFLWIYLWIDWSSSHQLDFKFKSLI